MPNIPELGRVFPGMLACLVLSTAIAQSATSELLRAQLEYGGQGGNVVVGGERIHTAQLMFQIYADRDFEPLWLDQDRVADLREITAQLDAEGLDPDDLPLAALADAQRIVQENGSDLAQINLEILATETLLRAAYLLNYGKVNPVTLNNDWNFSRTLGGEELPAEFVARAAATDDLALFMREVFLRGRFYQATMEALRRYREIAATGGWAAVNSGPSLRLGDRDPRIPELRARLRVTGELAALGNSGDDLLDPALAQAIEVFQYRHGLDADGIAGAKTIAAMNVPVSQRIDQIRLSLERMRWIQEDLSDNFLFVNIAGFRMAMVRGRETTWESKIAVGRPYRKTPIFRGDIDYLVFNPDWTVPPGILEKDILPAIKKDPSYLRRKNMILLTYDGRQVDPEGIDWQTMTARNFPYIVRQLPGPDNAMGQIKFIWPNKHFVFLHDTPSRSLFGKSERAFSSGCVRVEKPLELADILLAPNGDWDRSRIDATLATQRTQTVHLQQKVPVFLLYMTAMVEPDGEAFFYNDIYERDAQLLAELDGDIVIAVPDI